MVACYFSGCSISRVDLTKFIIEEARLYSDPCLAWGRHMKAAFAKASLITAVLAAISILIAWDFGSGAGIINEKLGLGVNITLSFLMVFPPLTYIFIQHNKLKEAYEDLEKAYFELQARSRMDHMTGLLNREALFDAMKASRSRIDTGMVLVVDADHFKSINDTYGHSTGDRALKLIAFALQNVTRKGTLLAVSVERNFAFFYRVLARKWEAMSLKGYVLKSKTHLFMPPITKSIH